MELKADVCPLPRYLLHDNAAGTELVAVVCLGHSGMDIGRSQVQSPKDREGHCTGYSGLSRTKDQCVEGDNPESSIPRVLHDSKEKSMLTRKPHVSYTQHHLESPHRSSRPQSSFSEITL